jgi:hypothetical protein
VASGSAPLPRVDAMASRVLRFRWPLMVCWCAAVALVVLTVVSERLPGLTARYFDSPDWTGPPVMTVVDRAPGLERAIGEGLATRFSVEWTGVVHVGSWGLYRFSLVSDDGSALWIDDEVVVDNRGTHSAVAADGVIRLSPGFHSLRVRYMNDGGDAVLSATWRRDDGGRRGERPLRDALLFPRRPGALGLATCRAGRRAAALVRTVRGPALAATGLMLGLWTLSRRRAIVSALSRRWRGGHAYRAALTRGAARVGTRTRVTAAILGALVPAAALLTAWPQGLQGKYFDAPNWSGPLLATTRDRQINLRRPVYDLVNPDYLYSVEWTGVLYVPARGEYEVLVTAQGVGSVRINETEVVSVVSPRSARANAGRTRLPEGLHALRVRFAPDDDGHGVLSVTWRRSVLEGSNPLRPIDEQVVFPDRPRPSVLGLVLAGRALLRVWWSCALVAALIACLVAAGWLIEDCRAWRRTARAWEGLRPREHHVYALLLAGQALAHVVVPFSGLIPPEFQWGYSALVPLGPGWSVAALVMVGLVVAAFRRKRAAVSRLVGAAEERLGRRPAHVLGLAMAGTLIFFALRNEFVNSDGVMFRWMVPAQVEAGRGGDVIIDEMWTSYLFGQAWSLTNRAFGWSVRLSYQVVSSIAGGAFLVLLWVASRLYAPGKRLAFVALVLAGGYVQVFFGDVENYAMVTAASFGYYAAAAAYLTGRCRLWAPSAALAFAMTCHLVAGFLLPSLALLYFTALRRRRWADAAVAAAAFAGWFGATILALGIPVESLLQGSWGQNALRELLKTGAGTVLRGEAEGSGGRWAWFALDAYHWRQYALLALMFPGHVLLIPLVLWRRVRADAVSLHLLVAAAGMAFFQFNYRALLPIEHDWNLYAGAAVPLVVLVWRALLAADSLRWKPELALGWALVSALHSYAWIVSNHYYAP